MTDVIFFLWQGNCVFVCVYNLGSRGHAGERIQKSSIDIFAHLVCTKLPGAPLDNCWGGDYFRVLEILSLFAKRLKHFDFLILFFLFFVPLISPVLPEIPQYLQWGGLLGVQQYCCAYQWNIRIDASSQRFTSKIFPWASHSRPVLFQLCIMLPLLPSCMTQTNPHDVKENIIHQTKPHSSIIPWSSSHTQVPIKGTLKAEGYRSVGALWVVYVLCLFWQLPVIASIKVFRLFFFGCRDYTTQARLRSPYPSVSLGRPLPCRTFTCRRSLDPFC